MKLDISGVYVYCIYDSKAGNDLYLSYCNLIKLDGFGYNLMQQDKTYI